MDLSKLTSLAQEALQKAQELAQENQHQVLDTGHMMMGLLLVDKEVVPRLLDKQGVNQAVFRAAVNAVVAGYPKVQGGELHISNALSSVLKKGISDLDAWGDSYLAVDALFYHLCQSKDSLAQLVKDSGIQVNQLKKDIMEMRNGEKVQSSSQENTYQSLEKFAKNLNEMAAKGKLDPVIGRDEEIRRVLQILTRRTKNNPILIGEPG